MFLFDTCNLLMWNEIVNIMDRDSDIDCAIIFNSLHWGLPSRKAVMVRNCWLNILFAGLYC